MTFYHPLKDLYIPPPGGGGVFREFKGLSLCFNFFKGFKPYAFSKHCKGKCVISNIRGRVMIEIIDIALCTVFPALYSTSQVCSVIFSSVAPRTKLYAPYNCKKYGWICLLQFECIVQKLLNVWENRIQDDHFSHSFSRD